MIEKGTGFVPNLKGFRTNTVQNGKETRLVRVRKHRCSDFNFWLYSQKGNLSNQQLIPFSHLYFTSFILFTLYFYLLLLLIQLLLFTFTHSTFTFYFYSFNLIYIYPPNPFILYSIYMPILCMITTSYNIKKNHHHASELTSFLFHPKSPNDLKLAPSSASESIEW